MTMFDQRTNLGRVVAEVRSHWGAGFSYHDPTFRPLSEAPSFGQSIFEYDAHSNGAHAYRYFAQR